MQDLHSDLAIFRVHSAGNYTMLFDLVLETELRSQRANAPREIRGNASCDNKSYSTPRSLSKIYLEAFRSMHRSQLQFKRLTAIF